MVEQKINKYVEEVMTKRRFDTSVLKMEKKERLDWEELRKTASDLFLKIYYMKKFKKICVLYDPDVDGLYSGYVMENYLYRTKAPAELFRFMNKNKIHGYSDDLRDFVIDNEIDLLFVVDAGSSDIIKFHENMPDTTVIILDHHEYDTSITLPENSKVTRLNVTDKEELPALSGCGMTYRFVEEMNKALDINIEFYEIYVGITVLSDSCSMTEPENRYYVAKAYQYNDYNEFLKYFSSKFYYGSNLSLFSFKLIPYLNALVRMNEVELAMKIVNQMDVRTIGKFIEANMPEIKARQEVEIEKIINHSQLTEGDGFVVLLRQPFGEMRTLNGLVANKLMSKFKKSAFVMVLTDDNDGNRMWKGSFRGLDYTNESLTKYGFECHGHPKACGVATYPKDLRTFCTDFEYFPEGDNEFDLEMSLSELNKPENLKAFGEFNEFASGNLNPIRIKLTDEITPFNLSKKPIGVSGKLNEIDFNNYKITDFSSDRVKDIKELIVTVTLDKYKGYKIIRNT